MIVIWSGYLRGVVFYFWEGAVDELGLAYNAGKYLPMAHITCRMVHSAIS